MNNLEKGDKVIVNPCAVDIEAYGLQEGRVFEATFLREGEGGGVTVAIHDGEQFNLEWASLVKYSALLCHHHKHGVSYAPFFSYKEPDYGFWEQENLHEEDQEYYVTLARKLGLDLEFDKLEWVEIVQVDLNKIPTI